MATIETQPADHIVLYNVPWSTYEALCGLESPGIKLTYRDGTLEIVRPSFKHHRTRPA